jgi:hypothetical protein
VLTSQKPSRLNLETEIIDIETKIIEVNEITDDLQDVVPYCGEINTRFLA